MAKTSKQTVTRREAARTLGLSLQRIDQLRRAGHLDSLRNDLTNRVHITRASLDALIELRGGTIGPVHKWLHRRAG